MDISSLLSPPDDPGPSPLSFSNPLPAPDTSIASSVPSNPPPQPRTPSSVDDARPPPVSRPDAIADPPSDVEMTGSTSTGGGGGREGGAGGEGGAAGAGGAGGGESTRVKGKVKIQGKVEGDVEVEGEGDGKVEGAGAGKGEAGADAEPEPEPEPEPDRVDVEPLTEQEYNGLQAMIDELQNHPYKHAAHVHCIDTLRRGFLTVPRADKPEFLLKLRTRREALVGTSPMTERMWLEWIEDEQSLAVSFEDRLLVMDLCTRAVTDQVASVRLFKAYGDFVEAQQLYASAGGDGSMSETEIDALGELFTPETVVDTYRQGAQATIHDIASSHLLWDKYRDLVMGRLTAQPAPETIKLVYDMYADRLAVPHATIDDTWAAFSQFVTRYDNANYESTMVTFNKLYAAANVGNLEREVFEFPLKREVDANKTPGAEEWLIWSEYLAWETSHPKKTLDEKMATALFERCLLRFGGVERLWEDYVYFLLDKGGKYSMPKVISVLQRATRHCPWSGSLWAQLILALEKSYKPFEEVSDIKHKATNAELMDPGGTGELLKVNVAWCGFLKRRAFDHDSAEEDVDMAEMGISEAVTECDSGKFADPDYRLKRIQINFYTQAKKPELARAIWKELAKARGDSYEFWLRFYAWELANGSRDSAGQTLKRGLQVKTMDWPEKVLDVWKTHVEDFGHVCEVEAMMVRHRRLAAEIAKRRDDERKSLEKEAQKSQAALAHQHHHQQQQQQQVQPGTAESTSKLKGGKRPRSDAGDEAQPTPKKVKAENEVAPVAAAPVPPPTTDQLVKRDRENSSIIVRNLPHSYAEVKVRQFFRDCGTINSLKVMSEPDGMSSTATVEFDSRDSVLAAQTKNMKRIEGHEIDIQVGTGSTLYVTNFPPIADEKYIRDLFREYGEIVDIRFPSLKYNTHRRFCYVQFTSATAAQMATSLDGKQLGEKEHLVAKISAPNQKKDRSSATSDGREVYIRNIDFQAREKDVHDVFAQYGKIEKVRLPPGPKKGMHKGFGFVVFESKAEANASLALNGVALKSRALEVSIAEVNPSKSKPGNAVRSASPSVGPRDHTNGTRHSPRSEAAATASPPPPSFEQIKKKTLGIMNLADTVNDTRLRTLFEPFGPLRKVTLRPDHQGAIVEYENVADAGKATLAMDRSNLDGMNIEIGELADLMKRQPEKKITKGFQKAAPVLVPASVRNPAFAGRGGGAGQKRRTGLGFVGAVSKNNASNSKDGDVEMKNAGNGEEKQPVHGRSNEDFKKMFLSSSGN